MPVMQTLVNPAIESIVRDFKVALQGLYGDRLQEVVLYGSYARGDYDEESDIDLMIILNDLEVDTIEEIFSLSNLIRCILSSNMVKPYHRCLFLARNTIVH
jgi:predicted nucleotidyltransferase